MHKGNGHTAVVAGTGQGKTGIRGPGYENNEIFNLVIDIPFVFLSQSAGGFFMRRRFPRSILVLLSAFGLLCGVARADFTKTIQGVANTPVQAATTWYFASCTQSLGVGSYTVNVAPTHGALSFSTVSGPLPGCPAGSPSLPAAAAFYTWTDTSTTAPTDYFQLYFMLGGQVAEVLDITVNLTADTLVITTTSLPNTVSGDPYSDQLTSQGGIGTVTWSLGGGNLPDGFSLSPTGVLSNSGTPPPLANPGTYTFTVTATDSRVSVSRQLSLDVISENCADTATIDPTKVRVLSYIPLTLIPRGRHLYLNTGFTLFGSPAPFYGISITTQPDAVTYAADGIPSSQIQLVYVQNLTNWSGYSEYTGPGGTTKEWDAIPVSSPEVDYPPSSPPVYYGFGGVFDSPTVHAPIRTSSGQRITAMHYNKAFTTYIGCHTARDTVHFDKTDPRYYIRTLATVDWGVNYSGSTSFSLLSCFNALDRFNCFTFHPDNTAGVYSLNPVAVPQGESNEPVVTPLVKTNYTCFNGGTCP
jgi:hypothetical protein